MNGKDKFSKTDHGFVFVAKLLLVLNHDWAKVNSEAKVVLGAIKFQLNESSSDLSYLKIKLSKRWQKFRL